MEISSRRPRKGSSKVFSSKISVCAPTSAIILVVPRPIRGYTGSAADRSRQVSLFDLLNMKLKDFVSIVVVVLVVCVENVSGFVGHVGAGLAMQRRSSALRVVTPIEGDEDWDRVMKKASLERVMIVDFQKSLCKPCKRVAPLFEEMAKKYTDSVDFFKVDADSSSECLALLKREGIKSVPTFHVYVGSAKVDTIKGANIELVEDAIVRERVLIAKNFRRLIEDKSELPPDDDTEKAMSRQNPGRVETLTREELEE